MPLVRDVQRPAEGTRRRPPAPAPAQPWYRGQLTREAVLALQRSAGNQAARALIQREVTDRPDLGADIVEFGETDPLPSLVGNLSTDPANKYVKQTSLGERIYKKVPKGGYSGPKLDPAEKERLRKAGIERELKKAKPTLFTAAQGGAKEGTFEYVANYLFSEVFGAKPDVAQEIWDNVWEVQDVPDGDPVAVRVKGVDPKELLQWMIDVGLDASWAKVPVDQLVKTPVGDKKPGASMPVIAWDTSDYFKAIYNWTPWPETSGVGFHTTDGAPGAVGKAKDDGGWGGITRPITVGFFQTRYALNEAWNPLKTWLDKKGPVFRQGIKDNELLSTVSVATAIHGSVRFPLADTPGRKGKHHVDHGGKDTFEMEVYIYAVRIGEGFATFAKQGPNAFGEIATGDIPIKDIIGWSKIERWHPYSGETGNPLTIGFDYKMTPLTRNPQFPVGGIYERIYASAVQEISNEIALTGKPYEG